MRDATTHQQRKSGAGSGCVRVRTPARHHQAELSGSSLQPAQQGLVPEVARVQCRKKAMGVLSRQYGLPVPAQKHWLNPLILHPRSLPLSVLGYSR